MIIRKAPSASESLFGRRCFSTTSSYRVICNIPLSEGIHQEVSRKAHSQYAFMLSTITYRDKTGLKEGQCAVYQRSFTKQATQFYSGLIGDYNPVHSGEGENADSATSSNRGIVQGLYVSSIFSSIFGTLLPGSLYRSQTLKFLQPVHTNQTVIGRVDITTIKNIKGKGVLVACNTAVYTKQDDANLEILLHHPPTNGLNIYGAAELWVPSNIQ